MARPNLFLDPGDELTRRVHPAATFLLAQSGTLPSSLQADSNSYYGCAAGCSVAETQQELLARTSFVLVLARFIGWAEEPLTPPLVAEMHAGIFQPVFGDRTLSFREPPARNEHRDDDGVEYPIWVVRGGGRPPELTTRRGVRSGQVARRVRDACRRFERDAPAAVGDLDSGSVVIAQLYARLIRTHPFGDGNGRTAWAAVQFAAGRLGLPFVQSAPTSEARVALGDAIRDGTRVHPLAERIREAMWG